MAEWTHSICEQCWKKLHGDRAPTVATGSLHETCCFCGQHTVAGIYVRHDPKDLEHCNHG